MAHLISRVGTVVFATLVVTTLSSCATPRLTRSPSGAPAVATPKYTPPAVPLSRDHAYFLGHASHAFWALMPYYVPQEEHACSAASIAMILNALNSRRELTSSDELVRQKPLIEKANHPLWAKAIESGNCLSLDDLALVIREILKLYGHAGATLDVVHIDSVDAASRNALRSALTETENTPGTFLIANFIQGKVTGDPEAMAAGHISPIGAYDRARHRVLILDVDRQWYEPYWVPEAQLLDAMNTKDEGSGKTRGFIRIRLPAR